MGAFWQRLRGARRIEWFAGAAVIAILLLLGMGSVRAPTQSPAQTDLEARLTAFLEQIDGAEGVRVMVSQDGDGEVVGAVILIDRLRDMRAYLSVQTAAATLLDLDINKIRLIGGAYDFRGDGG